MAIESVTLDPAPTATAPTPPTTTSQLLAADDFRAALNEAQEFLGIDRAVPTLDYLHLTAGSMMTGRLSEVSRIDVKQQDSSPCGDSGEESSTVCTADYSFALVEYTMSIDSTRDFGEKTPTATKPGESLTFTEAVGVVNTNRPDLDKHALELRDRIIATAPIDAQVVVFARANDDDKAAPIVAEWAVVDRSGSLTSMSPMASEADLVWTKQVPTLEAALALK